MKNFVSVSTNAARFQDISLNPQKLAGMCAKLKCCLNYEVDNYVEASKKMPPRDAVLQTADADYHQFKADILAGTITYSTDKNLAANLETITAERAREIIEMNRNGEKPLSLVENGKAKPTPQSKDLLAEADLSRFDKAKRKKKNNKNRNDKRQNGNANTTMPAGNASDNKVQDNNNRRCDNRNRDNKNRGNRQGGENRPPKNNRPPREQRPQGEPKQQGEQKPQGEPKPQGANKPEAKQPAPQPEPKQKPATTKHE